MAITIAWLFHFEMSEHVRSLTAAMKAMSLVAR